MAAARGRPALHRQLTITRVSILGSARGSILASAWAEFLRKRILIERSELAFFGVDAPAPPDDAQTGHHRDGEIDAEHSGDFAARKNAEQSRQRMQFHADSHDAGGDCVVLYHAPDDQKQKQESPVLISR